VYSHTRKVKAWRVDCLRSGDLEGQFEGNFISCEQLRFQDLRSRFFREVGIWTRRGGLRFGSGNPGGGQPTRAGEYRGGVDTRDMWCRNQPLCSPSTASAAKTVSKYPPNLPCFVALGDWGFVVMGWARMTGGVEFEGVCGFSAHAFAT